MLKVDRTFTYGAFALVAGSGQAEALSAAKAAAAHAIHNALQAGRKPVQIEVTVRVAPKD